MATFTYKAKDKKGTPVEGTMEAEDRSAVTAKLRQMGCFPIAITEGGGGGGGDSTGNSLTRIIPKLGGGNKTAQRNSLSQTNVSRTSIQRPGGAATLSRPNIQRPVAAPSSKSKSSAPKTSRSKANSEIRLTSFGKGKIKSAEISSFNRQLADLLGAGVPLVKSLNILQKQTDHPKLREVITQINSDVSGGTTFADALAEHPRLFSKLYVAMVRSGEAGGMLDDVLKRLADFSESEEQLRSKVMSALAYPVVMVIAGSAAVAVMFVYIIPKITGVFSELNQTLPAMTQLLITISDFCQQYWYIVIGILVGLIAASIQFVRTKEGRLFWHALQLRIPIFSDLVRKREVARFSRTLGSLLKNGVSILTALKITRDVLNNEHIKAEMESVIEGITQGEGMAEPLRDSNFFPAVTVNMMSVGEETGNLENVLLRISDSFELEVDRKVRTLTSLIEPLIIVAMGFVVGFIVIAMLLPIFSLNPGGT